MPDRHLTESGCSFSDTDLAVLNTLSERQVRSGAWRSTERQQGSDCDAFLVTPVGHRQPVLAIEKRQDGLYRLVDARRQPILGGRSLHDVVEPWT